MPKAPVLKVLAGIALTVTIGIVGCRSAVSTHVIPDPAKCGWRKKRLEGIPVTVKVPTHLEVLVSERRYINPDATPIMSADACPLAARFVTLNVREKDEVFTVDAVRPAAGTLTYSASFKGQFFKTFNSRVEDKTIESITNAIQNITTELGKLPKAKSTGFATADDVKLPYVDHVLAVREFDVHDPSLESEVREFLQTYLNGCAPSCAAPVH